MDIMLKRALKEFLRVLKGQRDSSSMRELERALKKILPSRDQSLFHEHQEGGGDLEVGWVKLKVFKLKDFSRSITKRIALFCVCSCVKLLLVIANMIVHKQDLRETIN